MSGKNNVNPNHYKVAGRQRQGEGIVHEREKQQAGLDAAARRRGPANFIPGAAPAGEAPPPEPARPEGKEARPMASSRQRAAARRNIKKAATAAQRKQTLKKLPKKTRIALGKQAAKAKRRSVA
jgi:hypothetical protein